VARKRGTYDVLKLREEEENRRLVIDLAGSEMTLTGGTDATSCLVDAPTILPVTMDKSTSTNEESTTTSAGGTNSGTRKSISKVITTG
jgi:hypothetical protein